MTAVYDSVIDMYVHCIPQIEIALYVYAMEQYTISHMGRHASVGFSGLSNVPCAGISYLLMVLY